MRAGVASGDLTPQPGIQLGGYPGGGRANTGVHDRLHAAALYLDDEHGGTFLLIATDLFWITRAQADAIRGGIAARSGLHPDRILTTASHTHSAPWMLPMFNTLPGEPEVAPEVSAEYVEFAVETCVSLGVAAIEGAFEAQVGYGLTRRGAESGIGGNRRDLEHGPSDPDLPVLLVRDRAGDLRAVWTAYACTPRSSRQPTPWSARISRGACGSPSRSATPGAVFLYSMGCAGDQSTRYYRHGQAFDEAERYGRILGDGVAEAVAGARWMNSARLRLATANVDLVSKQLPAPEVVERRVGELRKHASELAEANADYVTQQTASLALLGAQCEWGNALKQAAGTLK